MSRLYGLVVCAAVISCGDSVKVPPQSIEADGQSFIACRVCYPTELRLEFASVGASEFLDLCQSAHDVLGTSDVGASFGHGAHAFLRHSSPLMSVFSSGAPRAEST